MTMQVDLFVELDEAAWYERYYLDPARGDVGDAIRLLSRERVKLMAFPARIVRGEGREVTDPLHRVVDETTYPGALLWGKRADLIPRKWAPAAIPELAVMVAWECETARRTMFLAGMPEQYAFGSWTPGFRFLIHTDYLDLLKAFVAALEAETLALQIRHLVDPPAVSIPVRAISTDSTGRYLLTLAQDCPIADGDLAMLHGSRGSNLTRARGLRRIVGRQDSRTVILNRGPAPEKGPVRYTGGADLRSAVWTFSQAAWLPLAGPVYFRQVQLIPPKLIYYNAPFRVVSRLRGGRQPRRRGRKRSRV